MARYDVVVIGAGTAGIPCAIEASAGASVLVVDAAEEIGGTLHVSAGHMSAAGCRRQRDAGIADDPQLHFDDVMAISGGTADPELVRLAVEEAPRTLDWLEDLGFDFDPVTPAIYRGHTPYSRPRTFWGLRKGLSILETMRPSWEAAIASGRVAHRPATSAIGLEVSDGAVTGVVVDSGDGPESVEADAVVICAGGYGASPELFEALTPGAPRLVTNAAPTSRGDSIRLGESVGARVRLGDLHTPRLGLLEQPARSGRVDFWTAMMHLTAAERPPREIWVNRDGQRFVAEDLQDVTAQEHAAMAQPDSMMWVVFDHAAVGHGEQPLVRQWSWQELTERATRGDLVAQAASLQDLAETCGIDPVGLLDTIHTFNAAVDGAADPFGRQVLLQRLETPPFYAVASSPAVLCTFGGLDTDEHLRVRRPDGTVITGLFAAGESLGMGATSGRAFCGGMAVTPALGFGRILGRSLR